MDGCDRISNLPEFLLTQILSHLPTKDSVKTSGLSKRWEFVWRRVPGLELTLNDFPDGQALESFVNKFLEFNKDSRMQYFKIQSKQCNGDRLVEWIDTAVARGVQHVYVETKTAPNLTQNVYNSNTLVSLKLACGGLETLTCTVSVPRLKILHIEDVWYDYDPSIVEKIIEGSPALEELTVVSRSPLLIELSKVGVVKNLRVRSQTLKRLRLVFENTRGGKNSSVEIDAPRLVCMSVRDHQSDRIVVKNLSSLFMVDIDSEFNVTYDSHLDPEISSKQDAIRDFFVGISGVRYMIISHSTLEVLYLYSESVRIPKFNKLCRLHAEFSRYTLPLLPLFLGSCPNLTDLTVDFEAFFILLKELELSYVPRCLVKTLEYVEINKLIMNEEFGIKLVSYFLENSAILKKLSVSFMNSPVSDQDRDSYRKLLTTRKRSPRCRVSIY